MAFVKTPVRLLPLIALWGVLLTGTTVLATRSSDHGNGSVNSAGVRLPPDAAPPEQQVLTTFEADNAYMDQAIQTYQNGFGTQLIAEPLVRVDRNLEPIPAAASSWSCSKDGRTWTFTLQRDLIFSDGRPLIAQDYVTMMRRWADSRTGFDFEWYWRPIHHWTDVVAGRMPVDSIGVHAPDDRTLTVTTERPAPYMPVLLAYTWVTPNHAFEKYGPAWSTHAETSVSSGPFRLKSWKHGDQIVLEANPRYRGPAKPYLERRIGKLYHPAASPPFLPAYEAGEAEYILLTNQAEINRVKADPALRDQLHAYGDFVTYYLTMDTYHPPFNDLRVRQAFATAINRNGLAQSAIRGIGIPAYTMLPPGFPAADHGELADLQRYNPAKARTRLAEAGFPGGRGFPATELWLRNDLGGSAVVATEAIQAMLTQTLGVNVTIRPTERKTFLEALNRHTLTLGLVPYRYDYVDPSNLLTLWLSNGRHAWRNARFEQIIREANELVADPSRRLALYQEAEHILAGDVGGIFLWHPLTNEMWKPYVRGAALEPNRWGYRSWRGEQMQNLSPTLYITRDVTRYARTSPDDATHGFWAWLCGWF